jgi:hypothetical protein
MHAGRSVSAAMDLPALEYYLEVVGARPFHWEVIMMASDGDGRGGGLGFEVAPRDRTQGGKYRLGEEHEQLARGRVGSELRQRLMTPCSEETARTPLVIRRSSFFLLDFPMKLGSCDSSSSSAVDPLGGALPTSVRARALAPGVALKKFSHLLHIKLGGLTPSGQIFSSSR